MTHTITDWLRSLDLQPGDRIVNGERQLTWDTVCGSREVFEDYVRRNEPSHPEHWHQQMQKRLGSVAKTETWGCISRYDDWKREQEQAKEPEPWAELNEYHADCSRAPEVNLSCYEIIACARKTVEYAWPEIERRVKRIIETYAYQEPFPCPNKGK